MKLKVHEWGTGDRVALLIHGLFADHQNWYRVGPAIADRGYRVLAPDLRGHGASPRGPYSPELWAADLVESLPQNAELAIGHSLAGMALALAVKPLNAARAIYVDPTWKMTAQQHASFSATWRGQLGWSDEQWRSANPRWASGDIEARLGSMKRFDPACIDGLAPGSGHDHMPQTASVPSLVLLADPSPFVTAQDAMLLQAGGFDVQIVPGSSHSMFREDFSLFMNAIDAWLSRAGE
ncbi:alpha/beta fold hydrolase [Terriglobus sp. 2YAB30_2]|uniref:alpha/beta fold hydrolase n=1 Tax=Terriglobus sp. 2YAB30_2 TaxID=3233023 RepID=UPI003F99A15F